MRAEGQDPYRQSLRRFEIGVGLLIVVLIAGTLGYWTVGNFNLGDSFYETVKTITTVGYENRVNHIFGTILILSGVGTAAYTFSVLIETLVEGHIGNAVERRRMERNIAAMKDHVIICGWGRVGRANAQFIAGAAGQVVVVDQDPERLASVPYPWVQGDASDDTVLAAAGIGRARVLVAALNSDAANLYVVLSARAARPDLFIVARARVEAAEAKLLQAGANRVVNPQSIGGARMAAFALQPHVAEFVDVVMHDGSLEFRLEEIAVTAGSPLAGQTLRQAQIRDRTGALVLALRDGDGRFTTNPDPETQVCAGQILIAIGTAAQLESLSAAARR